MSLIERIKDFQEHLAPFTTPEQQETIYKGMVEETRAREKHWDKFLLKSGSGALVYSVLNSVVEGKTTFQEEYNDNPKLFLKTGIHTFGFQANQENAKYLDEFIRELYPIENK